MNNKLRLEIKDKVANIMGKYGRKKAKLFQEELVDWVYDPKTKTLKYYYAMDVKIKIEKLDAAQEQEIQKIIKKYGLNKEKIL